MQKDILSNMKKNKVQKRSDLPDGFIYDLIHNNNKRTNFRKYRRQILGLFPILVFYIIFTYGVYYATFWDWFKSILIGWLFGICGSIGHHRYFAHKSFKTNRYVTILLDIFGAISFQSSGIQMCSWHITHHQKEDKIGDPHFNPNRSLFYKYYWHYIDRIEFVTLNYKNIQRWVKYPELFVLHLIQPFFSTSIWLFTVYILDSLGKSFHAKFFYFLIPIFISQHFQLIDGYPGHITKLWQGHKCSFSEARDCWWIALLNAGGGWHGSHHQNPLYAKHGSKWYHLDFCYWIICFLEYLGIAHDVKHRNKVI